MYVNDADVPRPGRGFVCRIRERELFHGIPELLLTLPKTTRVHPKTGFGLSIEPRVPATTYCQRFADSVSTRTHTLTYICTYVHTEIRKRNSEETKHNKGLWAAHALLANHKNHIIIASLLGTQGSSPDGTDPNAETLTRPVEIPETHRCRKTNQVSQFTEKHTHKQQC